MESVWIKLEQLTDIIQFIIVLVLGMELDKILKFRKIFFALTFKWFKIKQAIKESNDVYKKLKEKVEDPVLLKEIQDVEKVFKEIFK